MFEFNPLCKRYKSVTGAVKEGVPVIFRVKCNYAFCELVFEKDGGDQPAVFSMRKNGGFFETEVSLNVGLYWYTFILPDGTRVGRGTDGEAALTDKAASTQPFQYTVYRKEYTVPEWNFGGIIYQIFPDRFCEGISGKTVPDGKIMHKNKKDIPLFEPDFNGRVLNNDFYGGDLKGIIEKLPYLKSLSVSAIYLNPIFSAYSNHRYDTGDYFSIDPLLGTMNDLEELIEKAGKYGIKIILDGVFSHTGDDSVYFDRYGRYGNGAYGNPDSPYVKWYKFIEYPDVYQAWWGVPTLPATNKEDEGFIDFITGEDGVISYYTKKGIGGWRLDVADELPGDFLKKVRKAVKNTNKDAVIIGEVWEDASNKISYGVRREYFQGEELDSVMNYPLKDALINYVCTGDCELLYKTLSEQTDHYPETVLNGLMNVLATHDTFRLLSAVSGLKTEGKSKRELAELTIPHECEQEAVNRLKAAVLLQYTLPGIPSVYYGDEIGMQGFTDPLNRRYFDWDNVCGEIYSWYCKLGKIRRAISAFKKGRLTVLYASGGGFVFKREDDDSAVLIAVNVDRTPLEITFKGKLFELTEEKEYSEKLALARGEVAALIKKNVT